MEVNVDLLSLLSIQIMEILDFIGESLTNRKTYPKFFVGNGLEYCDVLYGACFYRMLHVLLLLLQPKL